MKAIGIIPARYASTRFPGKCLFEIAGKPLVQWVVERATKARSLAEVIVATDDERIAKAVKGARVVMTSPNHPSGTDRLAEVAAKIECDIVVNIQGDEPLIGIEMIDQMVEAFSVQRSAFSVQMVTWAQKISKREDVENPNIVKVVFDKNGDALYFSRWPLPFVRNKNERANHYRHFGIYAYRRDFLLQYVKMPQTPLEKAEKLEQLRALENGHKIRVLLTDHESIGVDTPEDVAKVEKLLTTGKR
ncbi:MAG: 3-deoxy-manno-octulosonate cytidylyltransferase [Verrucomicrobiae bacterium]|nr:3-deoxy-manno-octulosonate cytidylyltransferase [Verrucomicrobiae bacterium]